MADPFVSFIIPVFNSEHTLGLCLESIFNIDYDLDKYEVIVVDNGSTDSSVDIASQYPAILLFKPVGTISSVRNHGSHHAKGELFAFVDSDCLIKQNWLKEAISVLFDSSVGAAGSGYLTPEHYTWVEKAWLYELNTRPFKTDFLPGGNLIVKSSVFRLVGGFNENLTTGEDSDLCIRINNSKYKVINYSKIATVHLGNSKSLKQFSKKEFWYGKNMIENLLLNPLDKVFYLSLILFTSTVTLVFGFVCSVLTHNYSFVWMSFITTLTITFTSSCYRINKSKKYRYILHLNLLYFIYYFVRSLAVFRSVYDRLVVTDQSGCS
jgi:glycosyltransferase involved in cell wall biosynthesis